VRRRVKCVCYFYTRAHTLNTQKKIAPVLRVVVVTRRALHIVPNVGEEEEKNPKVSRQKVMLWHQRLGHIGEKGLRLLHNKGMVESMYRFSMYFYFFEKYVYGK
jgi:hypothetical protein